MYRSATARLLYHHCSSEIVKDNDAILFRTFCFPFPGFKSHCIIWKLEILINHVCIHMIVRHSLPEEHLPLVQEARLGSRAPSQRCPLCWGLQLLVSLPRSLCLQYVWEPVQQEDKALPSQGSCFYGDRYDKEGDILASSLRSWCLTGSE